MFECTNGSSLIERGNKDYFSRYRRRLWKTLAKMIRSLAKIYTCVYVVWFIILGTSNIMLGIFNN